MRHLFPLHSDSKAFMDEPSDLKEGRTRSEPLTHTSCWLLFFSFICTFSADVNWPIRIFGRNDNDTQQFLFCLGTWKENAAILFHMICGLFRFLGGWSLKQEVDMWEWKSKSKTFLHNNETKNKKNIKNKTKKTSLGGRPAWLNGICGRG